MPYLSFALAASVLLSGFSWPIAVPGEVKMDTAGARDIFQEFHFSIKDGPQDPFWSSAVHLQVLARAVRLGMNSHSASEAWDHAEATFTKARSAAQESAAGQPMVFAGSRASALNVLLSRPGEKIIRLTAPILEMDVPLLINSGPVKLAFGRTRLRMARKGDYLIRIQHAEGVHLSGGILEKGSWGVLVAASRNIQLVGMSFQGLDWGGALITNSEDVTIWSSAFRGLGAAGIVLHGNTVRTTIAGNEVSGGRGFSNWDAGVVITDRNADPVSSFRGLFLRDHGVPMQPIVARFSIPHDNLIVSNHVVGGVTSGIYLDGASRNVLLGNAIEGNSNEGMCLDNGSTANVVALNSVMGNGRRWGKSRAQLKREYVAKWGRLADGTSPAKLPGISVDNAAYNQVVFNEIRGNYGGGVKMVRTALYNSIGMNAIGNDNVGESRTFHFFGVGFGSASADEPVMDLDFSPSRGNMLFNNVVTGPHYAGIFFEEGATANSIVHNLILGATHWAMESVVPQPNDFLDNSSSLPSRNIAAR